MFVLLYLRHTGLGFFGLLFTQDRFAVQVRSFSAAPCFTLAFLFVPRSRSVKLQSTQLWRSVSSFLCCSTTTTSPSNMQCSSVVKRWPGRGLKPSEDSAAASVNCFYKPEPAFVLLDSLSVICQTVRCSVSVCSHSGNMDFSPLSPFWFCTSSFQEQDFCLSNERWM